MRESSKIINCDCQEETDRFLYRIFIFKTKNLFNTIHIMVLKKVYIFNYLERDLSIFYIRTYTYKK